MTVKSFETPVLLLIFNRPDTTQKVFNQIRKARPAQLFVGTDAPRKNHPDDIEKCRKVLEIFEYIDWECKLSIFTHDENVGGKIGITSAMDWFFSQVDEGIILEDDCVPDESFFPYCQELLERYRDDERIMMVCGCGFPLTKRSRGAECSYYFSRYTFAWGYATWKRVWKQYDIAITKWPIIRDGGWLNDILGDRVAVKYWTNIFNGVYNGEIYSHDYQILFMCWIQAKLCIVPNTNLISNIGFNEDATHTKEKCAVSDLPVYTMQFPLKHPSFMIRDDMADRLSQKEIFPDPPLFIRIRCALGLILRKILKLLLYRKPNPK
jgi:hypothetical protein